MDVDPVIPEVIQEDRLLSSASSSLRQCLSGNSGAEEEPVVPETLSPR